jgi:hypothetical protein
MGQASRYLELARQYEAEATSEVVENPANKVRARELAKEFRYLAGKYVSLETLRVQARA